MKLNIVEKALFLQNNGYYKIGHFLLALFCIEFPREVVIPKWGGGVDSIRFVHRAPGLVVHPKTSVGKRVQFYQGVTVGKKKPWDGDEIEGGCEIQDDVILCAGCKVLFGKEKLIVGKGTIVGANSVLIQSTGENEISAGMPAKKIGNRKITK